MRCEIHGLSDKFDEVLGIPSLFRILDWYKSVLAWIWALHFCVEALLSFWGFFVIKVDKNVTSVLFFFWNWGHSQRMTKREFRNGVSFGIQHNHDSSIQNEQANVDFSRKKNVKKTSNFFCIQCDKKVQFYSKILAGGICERHNVMIHVQFRILLSEIHCECTIF